MDYIEMGLSNMGVNEEEEELWTEQNGHLS